MDYAYRVLADVTVEVVDGPGAGASAVTNASGDYALPGVFSEPIVVRASKGGFITDTRRLSSSNARPDGRVDASFFLDRLSRDITGDYTLTLTAAAECSELPAAARTRTYQATVTPSSDSANRYGVTLSGARFQQAANGLFVATSGDVAAFLIDPYGSFIVTEVLSGSTSLSFWGFGRGTVGASGLSAPFGGTLQYCADYRGPTGGPFPYYTCGVPPVDCDSTNHTLTLTPR